MKISYSVQPKPEGLAQAFIIGRAFIDGQPVALILGGNIFFGVGLINTLQRSVVNNKGGTIFLYPIKDPKRFGIAELGSQGEVLTITEKPKQPKSSLAVTGLCFYDHDVIEIAASLSHSARGEYEITDVNNVYLRQGRLKAELLGRGYTWLDAGTPSSLLESSNVIRIMEDRHGLKVARLEEIALNIRYIYPRQAEKATEGFENTDYARYVRTAITTHKKADVR
ncbi:MAG: glucose-1-phosphate thymidylyltransferase [Proteobacteria bacterium]|nr:glucose-1-phosphate thymidylyltransferase [Pseudomonadota bacterium]MBU1451727.1 glucose-1-phosphate thymidylyltransferase [Pseudomonadota bacterium]MBU2469263.1 glucose-1-phosphate thymidylyltransferase [Pseudomonadota bacterium]MBU2517547.1 glucose-1-phosphate thymidylyltransferase [Pseudomonadota bacterium]